MEEENRQNEEIEVPDDAVEDLEPTEGESDEVSGGGSPAGQMGWDVKENKKF